MKRILVALGLAVALLTTSTWAEEKRAEPDKSAKEKEDPAHEELRALMKEMVAAYNAGDVDKLLNTLDDKVIVTWQNSHVDTSREEVKAFIDKMTKGPNHIVEMNTIAPEPDASSLLYNDGKTAVAYGHSTDHYKFTDGTELDLHTRWTATLIKKDGKWKAASVHISGNMFENPILEMAVAKLTRMVILAGASTLVVGLVVGFLVGRIRKRA